jgi:hypothetical protein
MRNKPRTLGMILLVVMLLAACSPRTQNPDVPPETNQVEAMEVMDEPVDDTMSDNMASDLDTTSDHQQSGEYAMVTAESEMVDNLDAAEEDMEAGEMTGDDGLAVEGSGAPMGDDSTADDTNRYPDWFKATLQDARTGEAFNISDFEGNVVLVETLAMWCSNCFKQQGEVKILHGKLGDRDDFISLGIDIDPNENADALKSYIEKNGFHWRYTVAPREVAREIGQLYGDQFLNPPSTPMLIIDRHGETHPLPFGIKTADDLFNALQPFLEGEMVP